MHAFYLEKWRKQVAKDLNMCPVYECVGKDQIIVGVKRACDAEIRNQRVALQVRDEYGCPVGCNYDCIVVHLVEIVEFITVCG